MKAKIVFTGGGSAGHVTPNMALIEAFLKDQVSVAYIGSISGIEKKLIEEMNIPYYGIQTGKLRRYLTWQHILEPFKMMYGLFQSFFLLHRIQPEVVFSKGGFVSFPVVVTAWLKRIPVVAHESDMTPGLANKLAVPFVKKICINFPPAAQYFKHPERVFVTGTPIREVLLQGNAHRALKMTGFTQDKPTIMVIGGSLGAKKINQMVRAILPMLLERYQVIHICGRGNIDTSLENAHGYRQFEFVGAELGDLFALSDMVISRSGANALYELLTLAKPHLLIPLSKDASRGDQIDNAAYFEEKGVSHVLQEKDMTAQTLISATEKVMLERDDLVTKVQTLGLRSATEKVKRVIESFLESKDVKKKWLTE